MLLKSKLAFAKILCSGFIGKIIAFIYNNKLPSLLIKGIKIDTSYNQISPRTKAQIFFGIYESAEYRFCKKYIRDDANIIELGSSIGLISSFVSKNKTPKNIVAVEANPELISVIKANFKLNGVKNFKTINKAIGLDQYRNLWFSKGIDNTTGVISDNKSPGSVKVECTTLSDIISQEGFNNYILICDIEGGEVDILKDKNDSLSSCDLIIMEIHETEREHRVYNIDEIKDGFIAKGFKIIDHFGNTFVFTK